MIKVKNEQVVAAMGAAYARETKRLVSARAGTWEKTLDQFEKLPQSMNPSTIEKIADFFGFDVEITFKKKADAELAKIN